MEKILQNILEDSTSKIPAGYSGWMLDRCNGIPNIFMVASWKTYVHISEWITELIDERVSELFPLKVLRDFPGETFDECSKRILRRVSEVILGGVLKRTHELYLKKKNLGEISE